MGTGAHGLFDDLLAGLGRLRRVAVTVPNFMQAILLVAETDLIAALPSRLAATCRALGPDTG